ncbi:Rab family GTPase [Rubricoccus marinus]|uniref:GTP-binding protein n=1 Tax=Rubricoccus marinus TaxID=716817 RepID=A0A259U1L8_9BACT|nr:Rab family GTPase [Rubricoccus marinus]OZC03861.1 hypothetical protein BSZ36_13225 [Rubricoccus marinus]
MSEPHETLRLKVCLVGAPAVGKTSLVRRYVEGTFSEDYLTTIGVRISRKRVTVDGEAVGLIVWDINGDDAFAPLQSAYLRGASAFLLVADGTRPITFDRVVALRDELGEAFGGTPSILALNKRDLDDEWAIDEAQVEALRNAGVDVRETSARDGMEVEEAFLALARLAIAHARG